MTQPNTFRGGVVACVEVLARIVEKIEAMPPEDVPAHPNSRRALIVDLLTLIGEELAKLATGGGHGTVLDGNGAADAARGAGGDGNARP